jgi:uncharacterized protein (DUF2062 family)
MMLGAVPLAILVGLGFYIVTRWGIGLYQRNRRERIAAKRAGQGGVGAE